MLGDMGHSSHITNCVRGGGLNRCSLQEICGWELLPTTPPLQKPQCQDKSLCAPQGHRKQKTNVAWTQASGCPVMTNVLWLFSCCVQGSSACPWAEESNGFFGKSVLALVEEGRTVCLITAI